MSHILLDIPESFESERLILRCPLPGDGIELNECVQLNFKNLSRWMPWAKNLPTLEQSELFVRQSHIGYLARKEFVLLILEKSGRKIIGATGFHNIDWSVPKAEIGYWLSESYQGKGLMTEAVKVVEQKGHDVFGFVRLEIRADERNHRSLKVMERCGFKKEGCLRADCRSNDGMVRNTMVYSSIKVNAH